MVSLDSTSQVDDDTEVEEHASAVAPRHGVSMAALVTALFGIGGFALGAGSLGDNSFLWHLRTGELILDLSIQSRAATLATAVADSVGAQAAFFYQPTVFTKKLLPDEEKYLTLDTYEPARWDPAVKQARAALAGTPYVDVGDALDGASTPVLWDFVHTNEEGARLAAVALYSHLLPQLRSKAEALNS